MKMKIVDLVAFVRGSEPYTAVRPPKTKIEYAVQKVCFRILTSLKDPEKILEEARTALREKYAMVDADGCYMFRMKEVNGKPVEVYKYTAEKYALLKKDMAALEEKYLQQEIEIEPHIVEKFPPMSEYEVSIFRGLVIPKNYQLAEPIEDESELINQL